MTVSEIVVTFFQHQSVDESSVEGSESDGDALRAHLAALKEIADVSVQHERAMTEMMKKCS